MAPTTLHNRLRYALSNLPADKQVEFILEAVKKIEDDWMAKERERIGNPAWRVPPPQCLDSFVSQISRASAKHRVAQMIELQKLKE